MSAPAQTQSERNGQHSSHSQPAESFKPADWLERELNKSWLDRALDQAEREIDLVSRKADSELSRARGDLQRVCAYATAKSIIRKIIDPECKFEGPVVDALMALQGEDYGFKTDQVYSKQVVVKCVVDAYLEGYKVIGNEFNIIGGRMMPVYNGIKRKVEEFEGLTDLVLNTDGKTRAWNDMGIKVTCTASWKIAGRQESLTMDGAITLHRGAGIKNCQSRLERQLLAAVWNRINKGRFGSISTDEVEEEAKRDLERAQQQVPEATAEEKAWLAEQQTMQTLFKMCESEKLITKDSWKIMIAKYGVKSGRDLSIDACRKVSAELQAILDGPKSAPAQETAPADQNGRITKNTLDKLRLTTEYHRMSPPQIIRAMIRVGARGEEETAPFEFSKLSEAHGLALIEEIENPSE